MKTLKGGLSSVSSEDWKEVLEWLLKRKEDTGKMKWDDAYGHDAYLPREEMFIYLVKLKTNPTHDTTPRMVGKPKASPQAIDRIVCKVRRYLNLAVDEVHWSDRLNRFNHNAHFPYLVTHFTDAMPISSIGGALSDILFNPKYAGCV